MTPSHYEYFYAIVDYLREHQTGNFISNKISNIIEKITADLVKNNLIKEILKQANMLVLFVHKSHLAIYDTTNSIIYVRSAIDKILEKQSDIFINIEVFGIASDENNTFYTSCKRIALIFKPVKQIITLLESCIASLANCFLGIIQLAAVFREYLLATISWGVVKDEYTHLQELAKIMFAIVLFQDNCGQNFSILKWFIKGCHIWLQVSQLESMAQIYSFYVSNIKKKLNFCDNNSVDIELCNSMFNKIIFAEIDCPDLNSNKKKDEVEVVNFTANEIAIVFQN
ncbi:13586_t:CDS:2 [Cetraspora pellucida]|uniref:13586_t:CDS:1 n=1 Tax=Cetraspora pellucida TaxID=1433469 RepID=A0A9N9G328_9GLOM|nr:13586_t:CDS:2 [Cetraspora pellucida]